LAVLAVLGLAFNAKKAGFGNRPAYFATGAVAVQFLLGITTLLHGVPVARGGLHQAGAVVLLGSVIWLAHGLGRTR
jgi:cytochrome c oxidase assembly protein subunit 15